ncbi:hypothetical protein PoB_001249700 [Plakobranchus ocellatus]|uniref:Uncharacterized protein n=1 Tax=Plakobranchus ocellatus TaxID=259542 RepID=A0AAV3YU55_9GAST|nr:hypothetical protein PoB_001249700 [Plakobranchus ocellatus]
MACGPTSGQRQASVRPASGQRQATVLPTQPASERSLAIQGPQQGDLRLSGPPSGQGAGGGARTRDTRVLADLRADLLATVPSTHHFTQEPLIVHLASQDQAPLSIC